MVSSGPNCTGEKCIPPNGELGAGSSTGSPRTRLHISDKPICSRELGGLFPSLHVIQEFLRSMVTSLTVWTSPRSPLVSIP